MKLPIVCAAGLAIALLTPGTLLQAQSSAVSAPAAKVRKKRTTRRTTVTHASAAAPSASLRPVSRTVTQAAVIHSGTAGGVGPTAGRRRVRHRRVFFNPWTEPTYADSTAGDNVEGEDLAVRKAAIDALGPYNGTVVVADPSSGRILSIVNQKLALKGAYQPCSTVKMVVSLASLSEGVVDSSKPMYLTRRYKMDMTQALARSNNLYFAKLGQQLGFERVVKYAKLFGLGEKAGLDIPGEEPGYLADATPQTGVGMMTSFGDGIRLTPLELTSLVVSLANGGTMYYLQYPRTQEEVEKFVPRIKRTLDIGPFIPQVTPGMMAAVEYGTARRASYDPQEPIFGKTGTCTDTAQPGVHLGWFGSFNNVGNKKVVVVVLLTGGRGISGPIASGVAGNVYHNLSQQHYFLPDQQPGLPTALISLQNEVRQ
jgi:penicillin-binding protein 2